MAWVQNRREQFINHWFVVGDNGKVIGEEHGSREEAEKACAAINTPPEPETVPSRPSPKTAKTKKGAKKK